MTPEEPTVTLEDVAQLIDDAVEVCQINGQQEFTPIFGQHMALVRAAAEIVKTAKKFIKGEPDRLSYEADLKLLGKALREFDRQSKQKEIK